MKKVNQRAEAAANNDVVDDIISKCIWYMGEQLAEALTRTADPKSYIGKKLISLAYPNKKKHMGAIKLPVEVKGLIKSYGTGEEGINYTYQAFVYSKNTDTALFPFDIEITVSPYNFFERWESILRESYEELQVRYILLMESLGTVPSYGDDDYDEDLDEAKAIVALYFNDLDELKEKKANGKFIKNYKKEYGQLMIEIDNRLGELESELDKYEEEEVA